MEALEPGDFSHTNTKREKKKKKKNPSVEGGGRVDGRGRAFGSRRPAAAAAPALRQLPAEGSNMFPLFKSQALCQPRMDTNKKYTEVGNQMQRDQPPPAPQKVKTSVTWEGGHCTHTNISISQSRGRDLESERRTLILCFFFQALACKVQRLHAKLERCRKAEGGGVRVRREGCLTPATQASL